jgi:hypothetical protein
VDALAGEKATAEEPAAETEKSAQEIKKEVQNEAPETFCIVESVILN